MDFAAFYRGRPVMVTGGMGFIGSNLARRLVELGARVIVVDSLIPGYGGNHFNLDGVEGEDWVKLISERAIGRRLKVKVTERKYVKKDGTEGVAYQGSFFFRHPDGPELPF